MPNYRQLKYMDRADRNRTIDGLNRLRNQLMALNFPTRKTSKSLILGTWNLRNFDDDRFNYGRRTDESLYYIAEILSMFDVMAVQEICEDLQPLKKLLRLLGNEYDFILTDVTHASLGGNQERLGFIYDRNKVRFTGIAGEIVLPKSLAISDETRDKRQFARTPFGVEFQSGWFLFNFSTVHIYFGSNRGNTPQYKRRVEEINAVAKYLAGTAKKSEINQILVGDFNIIEKGSKGFNALEENGFSIVQNRMGSNRDQTKYYDQISFISRKNELEFLEPKRDDRVIQFFNTVYRKEDFDLYRPIMNAMITEKLATAKTQLDLATTQRDRKKYNTQIETLEKVLENEEAERNHYEEWRTFQMSDHLPLWVEIKVDFSNKYLDFLKKMD
jgi:exonuclease III